MLGVLGFGANGVVGGSIAAAIQPANVAAGSWFATAVSVAMGGPMLPLLAPVAGGAAAIGGVGYTAYLGYFYIGSDECECY